MLISIPLYKKVNAAHDKVVEKTRSNYRGTRVIRAFNRTEYEDKRFKKANDELTSLTLKVSRIFAGLIPAKKASKKDPVIALRTE